MGTTHSLMFVLGLVFGFLVRYALERFDSPAPKKFDFIDESKDFRQARIVQSDRGGYRAIDPNATRPHVSPQGRRR